MMKSEARRQAKSQRRTLSGKNTGEALTRHLPPELNTHIIGGYSPIGNEIDVWPLLYHLHGDRCQIALPVVKAPATPLMFRRWTPEAEMKTDRYGVSYPAQGETLIPNLILVPLLAFTARGDRLGYGGGYYDRTLEALRRDGEVFACGVGFAGQEVSALPTDVYDAKLNGILTEDGFRRF